MNLLTGIWNTIKLKANNLRKNEILFEQEMKKDETNMTNDDETILAYAKTLAEEIKSSEELSLEIIDLQNKLLNLHWKNETADYNGYDAWSKIGKERGWFEEPLAKSQNVPIAEYENDYFKAIPSIPEVYTNDVQLY